MVGASSRPKVPAQCAHGREHSKHRPASRAKGPAPMPAPGIARGGTPIDPPRAESPAHLVQERRAILGAKHEMDQDLRRGLRHETILSFMDRAFSPRGFERRSTSGVARVWYGAAPLALEPGGCPDCPPRRHARLPAHVRRQPRPGGGGSLPDFKAPRPRRHSRHRAALPEVRQGRGGGCGEGVGSNTERVGLRLFGSPAMLPLPVHA